MNKSKRAVRKRLLLDTTVQIEKFKTSHVQKTINCNRTKYQFYTSYYVLYEFKTGLIQSLINLYLRAKISNSVAEAFISFSNSFKIRELKNGNILLSLILKIHRSLSSEKKEFLSQIETVIFNLMTNFEMDISNYVGDFGYEKLVKYPICYESSYKGFIDLCKTEKCIKLQKFFEKQDKKFKKLLDSYSELDKHKYLKEAYSILEEISKDITKSNMVTRSRKLGDVVISMDCPQNFNILTSDSSFEVLSKILGHEVMKLDDFVNA